MFLLLFLLFGVSAQNDELGPTVPGEIVKYPDNYCQHIQKNEKFDVIVVGAGPGGCAVSRRLAEDPSVRVLLIEAGGDPPTDSDIPGFLANVGPDFRWRFTSTRTTTSCQGSVGKRCYYTPGRVLGGSSTVNAMMYVRGSREDFNEWAAKGNPGWSYEEVLPYFKKMENYIAQEIGDTVSNTTVSSVYHRRGGPFTANFYPIDQKTHQVRLGILEAAAANGLKFNPDINGADQIGFTNLPGSVDATYYRQNTAKVYLRNLPDNLKVCKYAIVSKVLFEGKSATGVQVYYPVRNLTGPLPRPFNLFATKEVILSAGPFNSPAILERSGIGQRSVLQKAGVKLLVERNGVGENVYDHFIHIGNSFRINYNRQVAGNPTANELISLTGFTNITDPTSPFPDIQYLFSTYRPAQILGIQLTPSIANQYAAASVDKDIFFFGPAVLHQGKPGTIHIDQSADPRRTSVYVTNQLTTPYDTRLYTEASRLARKIMSHEALAPLKPEPFILKECSRYPFNSDQEIMCAVRQLGYTLYHVSGACAMGDPSNKNSVVDSRLRVIGVEKLRVVDSSIMPRVTRGNTEIPTVMIGEKAADLIKEDLGLCSNEV